MMIDPKLPLELEDGREVRFLGYHNDLIKVELDYATKLFDPNTGQHIFHKYPNLRNKIMKLVDINKPVQVGGKEAKIIHVFDNGNLAVVVDGRAEVQNYNQYGQANGEGAIILRNTAEQKVSFHTLWASSGGVVGSMYHSKDAAKTVAGNLKGFAGVLKITLVDGIATSAEIV